MPLWPETSIPDNSTVPDHAERIVLQQLMLLVTELREKSLQLRDLVRFLCEHDMALTQHLRLRKAES